MARARANPFVGAIAFENRETVDGRTIVSGALDLKSRGRLYPRQVYRTRQDDGAEVLGRITKLHRHGDIIVASGRVLLEPGAYEVGVDLYDFKARHVGSLLIIEWGRIMGLCVYENQKPAWPDAKIIVTSG